MTVAIERFRYMAAPCTATRITFDELGVPRWYEPTLAWRRPNKDEIKSGQLKGALFRRKRDGAIFEAYSVDWISLKKPALVHYVGGVLTVREVEFHLLTTRMLSTKARLQWVAENCKQFIRIIVPTSGCSLHGDIDISLFDEQGNEYTVAYNY